MTPTREQIQLVDVLAAIGHPIRAEIVRVLASGEEKVCGEIVPGVPKSTLTNHWRTLRESGVIYQRPAGRQQYITLRKDDLNARFPGLLDLIVGSDPVHESGT